MRKFFDAIRQYLHICEILVLFFASLLTHFWVGDSGLKAPLLTIYGGSIIILVLLPASRDQYTFTDFGTFLGTVVAVAGGAHWLSDAIGKTLSSSVGEVSSLPAEELIIDAIRVFLMATVLEVVLILHFLVILITGLLSAYPTISAWQGPNVSIGLPWVGRMRSNFMRFCGRISARVRRLTQMNPVLQLIGSLFIFMLFLGLYFYIAYLLNDHACAASAMSHRPEPIKWIEQALMVCLL